jgi:cytochrome c biogenesis protein CcdA/thiol-disulfide isomerase/thioredoxin
VATLIVIGLLAGAITAISPCVLPVLPILLAGSATGPPRRPYAIVAGLVASFTVFTLFAAALLDAVGLPDDFLRNLALVLLFLVAATLLFPRVGELVSVPLSRLARRPAGDLGGGFLLGASLGLVFVPCAGPVLAAVAVIAADRNVGADGFVLTLAYAAGAGLPMLAVAVAGQRALTRTKALQARAATMRRALGAVIAVTALAIVLELDRPFQTSVPGYTAELQQQVEESASAERAIGRVTGSSSAGRFREAGDGNGADLPDLGRAPEVAGISQWLNTRGEKPLSLESLRGKVVLVDFWTYSCINCLRTLPHLKAWYERYRESGLEIVGVHAPEFAFERVTDNVREAVSSLGVEYPVALDNDFATWKAYDNQYWPAKYLIDRDGDVRYTHFGEGEYAQTEKHIRDLLAEGAMPLPRRTAPLGDETPKALITPELYLGYHRASRYGGRSRVAPDRPANYELPASLPESSFAFGGRWRVEGERVVTAGKRASLLLRFRASKVHLVLGGRGSVEVEFGGRTRTVRVRRDRLYTLLALGDVRDGVVTLRFTPGVAAYAFTFGADASKLNSGLGRRPVAPRALDAPGMIHQRFLAPA